MDKVGSNRVFAIIAGIAGNPKISFKFALDEIVPLLVGKGGGVVIVIVVVGIGTFRIVVGCRHYFHSGIREDILFVEVR